MVGEAQERLDTDVGIRDDLEVLDSVLFQALKKSSQVLVGIFVSPGKFHLVSTFCQLMSSLGDFTIRRS